jgi:hypothetical protein
VPINPRHGSICRRCAVELIAAIVQLAPRKVNNLCEFILDSFVPIN